MSLENGKYSHIDSVCEIEIEEERAINADTVEEMQNADSAVKQPNLEISSVSDATTEKEPLMDNRELSSIEVDSDVNTTTGPQNGGFLIPKTGDMKSTIGRVKFLRQNGVVLRSSSVIMEMIGMGSLTNKTFGSLTPQWMDFNCEEWTKEITMEKLWTSRKWKDILQHFFTAFILSFSPSAIDVVTDHLATYTYFYGAEYTKNVQNTSDIVGQNCTLLTTMVTAYPNSTTLTTTYTYSCYEQNLIYGVVTLSFTFLPALIFVPYAVWHKTLSWRRWYSIFTIPFFLLTFPLQLFAVKILHLINPDKNMEILSEIYTFYESQGESSFQLCAQLFMVLSRDRDASYIQKVSIAASSVLMIKPSLEQFLGKDKKAGSKEEILSKYFTFIPLFLSTAISRILPIAIICVLLRWNAAYFYVTVFGLALFARFITSKCMQIYNLPVHQSEEEATLNNIANQGKSSFQLFYNIVPENLTMTRCNKWRISQSEMLSNVLLWSVVNGVTLTTLAILVNCNAQFSIVIPEFYPFFLKDHPWSEKRLVSNIKIFNTLYAISMGTGIVSIILFLFQIYWANKDSDEETAIGPSKVNLMLQMKSKLQPNSTTTQ